MKAARRTQQLKFQYDKYLLFAVVLLSVVGLMMVTSASMAISERHFDRSFYYLIHQGIYLISVFCFV